MSVGYWFWSYFANAVFVNFGLFFVNTEYQKAKVACQQLIILLTFKGMGKDTEDSHSAALIDVISSAVVVHFPATHHHASLKAGEPNKYVCSGLATIGAECQPWTSNLIPDLIQSWDCLSILIKGCLFCLYMRSHYQQHKSLFKKDDDRKVRFPCCCICSRVTCTGRHREAEEIFSAF